MDIFRKRLKEIIEESGLTYDEIKDMLGIKSKGTITKYCNGQTKNIVVSTAKKIADVFGVSPSWLVGWSDKKYVEK